MKAKVKKVCECIECGCDDNHACADLIGDPCRWYVQSKSGRFGVCSECPVAERRWRRGDRKLSERAKAVIADRRALERGSRRRRLLKAPKTRAM